MEGRTVSSALRRRIPPLKRGRAAIKARRGDASASQAWPNSADAKFDECYRAWDGKLRSPGVRPKCTYLAAIALLTDRYWRSIRLILRLCAAICRLSMRRFAAIFRLSWRRLAISLDMVFPFLPPAYSFRRRLVRGMPFAIDRSGIARL
jgi:hypothetical protein